MSYSAYPSKSVKHTCIFELERRRGGLHCLRGFTSPLHDPISPRDKSIRP